MGLLEQNADHADSSSGTKRSTALTLLGRAVVKVKTRTAV